MSLPRIVALETSGRIGSLALAQGPELLVSARLSASMKHAVELMPTLQRLCQQLGWQPADLQHLYLAIGPGSFTGLRIAVSLARALHQALGLRLVAIPTLDILACNAPPGTKHLAVLLDAKRQQVFAAGYRLEADTVGEGFWDRLTSQRRWIQRLCGPSLVDPRQLVEGLPKPLHLLGEGLPFHRENLQREPRLDYLEVPMELWPGDARAVHTLGWQRAEQNRFDDPADLLPFYLRLPEAEELWNLRHPA